MAAIVLLSSPIFFLCRKASVRVSSTSLLSAVRRPHFSRFHRALIPTSVPFCIPMKALLFSQAPEAAPTPPFAGHLSALRRAPMHLSPHLLISELAEKHTAPCWPRARTAGRALIGQPSSRQYLGTLPAARYRDPSRAAMHNNRFD